MASYFLNPNNPEGSQHQLKLELSFMRDNKPESMMDIFSVGLGSREDVLAYIDGMTDNRIQSIIEQKVGADVLTMYDRPHTETRPGLEPV